MNIEKITDPLIRAAFQAWNNADRKAFTELLSKDIIFLHNGEKDDVMAFSDEFFFGPVGAKFTQIKDVKNGGKTVYATLSSEKTGDLDVLMDFKTENGKILFISAGRP